MPNGWTPVFAVFQSRNLELELMLVQRYDVDLNAEARRGRSGTIVSPNVLDPDFSRRALEYFKEKQREEDREKQLLANRKGGNKGQKALGESE